MDKVKFYNTVAKKLMLQKNNEELLRFQNHLIVNRDSDRSLEMDIHDIVRFTFHLGMCHSTIEWDRALRDTLEVEPSDYESLGLVDIDFCMDAATQTLKARGLVDEG